MYRFVLSLLLLILTTVKVFADTQSCEEAVLGARFLHKKFPELYKSSSVDWYDLNQPEQKVAAWIDQIEGFYRHRRDRPASIESIKEWFFKKYVTPADQISESYFQLQVRLAREQGHGNIELTAENRRQISEIAVRDQKDSLAAWIDYLTSPDTDMYPTWVKYWALMGVVKMAKFDPEKVMFQSRSHGQAMPFPELNREAFALVIDSVVKKVHGKSLISIQDPALKSLLENPSFSNLYARAWIVSTGRTRSLDVTSGEWVKFDRGSDPTAIVQSLQGQNTGWCTAGFSTAEIQLKGGDFYIYYSLDENGQPTVPRLAIRMQGQEIAEVRGISENQNLDSSIAGTSILEDKLLTFGENGRKYRKRSHDMKVMTEIEKRHLQGLDLTSEDLRFLYEMDGPIEGFGYEKDPRIREILSRRQVKKDLAMVFENRYPESAFSITSEEALRGGIKFHYGDLNLSGLSSVEGIVLPQSIGRDLNLDGLHSAQGLVLPQSIGGDLNLYRLNSAQGLVLPQSIGGSLYLTGLISAQGLVLPQSIGGNLYLNGLISAQGLVLPQSIGGNLNLGGLTSTEGLVLPQSVGGGLDLGSLTSTEGLVLPQSVGGDLNLGSLTSAEGLVLPQSIGGGIKLFELVSAEGLVLPKSVAGYLDLNGLISAEGLVLPQSIGRGLHLRSLISANGLVLPQSIGGDLHLGSLTSAEGLVPPQSVGGSLFLNVLSSAKGLMLPQLIGGSLYMGSLTSTEGLVLPKSLGGKLQLGKGLTSSEHE